MGKVFSLDKYKNNILNIEKIIENEYREINNLNIFFNIIEENIDIINKIYISNRTDIDKVKNNKFNIILDRNIINNIERRYFKIGCFNIIGAYIIYIVLDNIEKIGNKYILDNNINIIDEVNIIEEEYRNMIVEILEREYINE